MKHKLWNLILIGIVFFGFAPRALAGDVLNVKDFGAVMDGVTDDTAAVLAVFAAAGDRDKVYFPSGVAMLSQSITVSNQNITIVGEDVSSTLLKWTAPGGIDINLTMNQSCEIANLQLIADCADAGTAIRLTSVNRASRAMIARHLKITRMEGAYWNKSIHLSTGTLSILKDIFMSGLYPYTTHHLHIDGYSNAVQMSGLTARGSQYGIFWEGSGEGHYVHDSVFYENDYGLMRYDATYTEPFYDVQFCNVTSRVHCASFYNHRNTTLAGNTFVREGSSDTACIRLEGVLALSVNFTDNLIKNIGSGVGPGIWVTDGRQMNLVNNTVDGFDTGMLIDGNSRLIRIGDTFTNCTNEVSLGANVSDIYRR